jgi:phage-related protein
VIAAIKALIDTLVGFFSKLWQKVSDVLEWCVDLIKDIFTAAWDFAIDAVCWAFDGLLGIIVSAVNAIDTSGVSGAGSAWGGLPAEVTNVLGLLGIGEAASIIVAAIGIRLVLQLIPFTRLGS